jgi:two-component system, chemotaxis family, sensor kinase CheA
MNNYLSKLNKKTKEKTSPYFEIPEKIFSVLNNADINLISKAHKEKSNLYLIKISIKDDIIQTENIQVVVDKLNLFGKVVCIISDTSEVPDLADFNPEHFAVGFSVLLISPDKIDVIKEVFSDEIDEIKKLKRKKKNKKMAQNPKIEKPKSKTSAEKLPDVSNKKSDAPSKIESTVQAKPNQSKQDNEKLTPPKVVPNAAAANTLTSTTVRVDIDRLDKLMNLVGELVIDRTRLHQLIFNLSEKYSNEEGFSGLNETTERMARITNELRESIMQVRMVPIGNVFKKFPRVVRDLSKARGKEVEIAMSGETTELDKTIIEEISDPMIHLIRNALDHGIEDPATRKKVGKKPKGTLSLNAYHEGNHIIIVIGDDGAGLNPEKIKKVAIKKGVATAEQLEKMSVSEINHLIFSAGFSTADKVTDISGRGVGMDVVSSNIKKLNGIIEIETKVGEGTKFIIKLPLTLAIINALLIKVGDQTLAIPLAQVIESVIITPDEIKTMEEREEVVILRERVVTLLRLKNFFKIKDKENDEVDLKNSITASKKKKKIFVVIVGIAEEKIGIVVDSLLGQQEIVIKSLDSDMIDVKGIAGATILGEGNVVLILDVATLIYENRSVKQREQEQGV